MLIRRQDIGVLFFYFLGYSKIRNLLFRLRKKPVTVIVTFHDVPRQASGRFTANLAFLRENANVVGLVDYFSGNLAMDRINVVLTFDDGYKSWTTIAAPILKRLSLPATFFLASGFVGLSRAEQATFMRTNLLLSPEQDSGIEGLSADDVQRLVADGFTIGGHTVSHCNLAEQHDRKRLIYEVAEDKRRLENVTGTRIEYFAYPFGAYRNPAIDLVEILKDCGYIGAVSTISGLNTESTNSFLLHRELTPASLSEWVFRARACGNYDAIRFLKGAAR